MTKTLKLRELFDQAAESAAKMFLEHDDHEVLPMWHAITGNNENIIIATPWGDDKEKQITVNALREMFVAKQVKRYAFIVEAWIANISDSGRTPNTYAGPPPSKHPDRREVLMITAEDRDGSQIMGFYYILRPEHGPPKLSPLEVKNYDKTAGRMMGLLT